MRKTCVAALAAALLATAAPAADAYHTGYRGGCSATAVPDTTPGGQLGGQNQRNGTITVHVVATDGAGAPTAASISVDCALLVNGAYAGVVLSASGTGSATNSSTLSYTAGEDDVVTWCEHVTVDGEVHYGCHDDPPPPPPPPPPPAAVPAYGIITITDAGTGPTMTTTYDPALWNCYQTTYGLPATQVTGTCIPLSTTVSYHCPLMILTTTTVAGVAGGRVECNPTQQLDTGVVSGSSTSSTSGDIGAVDAIVCTAYAGITGVLIPRYTVTCNEPGLPG